MVLMQSLKILTHAQENLHLSLHICTQLGHPIKNPLTSKKKQKLQTKKSNNYWRRTK